MTMQRKYVLFSTRIGLIVGNLGGTQIVKNTADGSSVLV